FVIAAGCAVSILVRRSTAAPLRVVSFVPILGVIVASILPVTIRQLRTPLPAYNRQVQPEADLSVSRDQISSARWIRDHSGVDDLVATNRHCTAAQGDPCDPRRFFVAAYSERQVLVEGWAYTSSWLKTPEGDEGRVHRPFWNPSHL